MNVRTILKGFSQAAREHGLIFALRGLAQRANIRYRERAFGIHTEAAIELSELGIHNSNCKQYSATDYDAFRIIMRELAIEPNEHVFLDYGAGMGRAMVLAATYPFRRVLGVEISTELAEIARSNFIKSRPKLKCSEIEIVTCDATRYSPPSDVSVLYFNNPFSGEILDSVLKTVQGLAENANSLFVVCNLPHASAFELQVRRLAWLELKKEFPLPSSRHCLILRPRRQRADQGDH